MLSRCGLTVLALVLAACSDSGGAGVCAECVDEKCSDLLPACEGDPDCACMVGCLGEGGIPGVPGCLDTCGLAERPAAFLPIEECTAVACPDTGDECSTPSDWTPPGNIIECEGSAAGLGGGALPDCSFDPALPFDPDGDVLQLQSADEQVCVRLERRDDGPGSLANTSWTLIEIRVGPLGEVALVEDEADQCWYSSHHNFRDWVHAWTGTRHFDLVLLEDGHGGGRTYELYAFEQGPVDAASCAPTAEGAQCIEGPIALLPFEP